MAAFLLGLAGTLLVLSAHLAGIDSSLELQALDLRFGFSNAPTADNILHVDIDDGSLIEVGHWPWPRAYLAGVIDILSECGAKVVLVDLLYTDPQKVRYESPVHEVYYGGEDEIISQEPPKPVFDDAILASSVRRAGNVSIAMHIQFRSQPPLPFHKEVGEILSAEPETNLASVLRKLSVEKAYTDDVRQAYLHHRSLAAIRRFAIRGDDDTSGLKSGDVELPLVTLASAAAGSGFVNFFADPDKIVRRTPLLAIGDSDVYPQFAFALAARMFGDQYGGLERITHTEGQITIHCKDGTQRTIPLDSTGYMLVNWPRQAIAEGAPTFGLEHISAGRMMRIWLTKRKRRLNADRIKAFRVQFINLGRQIPEDEAIKKLYYQLANEDLIEQFDDVCRKRRAAEAAVQRTILYDPARASDRTLLNRLRQTEAKMQTAREQALDSLITKLRSPGTLEFFLGRPASVSATQPAANSPEFKAFEENLARAKELFAMEDRLKQENARIDQKVRIWIEELKPVIAGKICLIGATAEGVPDFVPTAAGPRTPGVVMHSNVINTILSGSFISTAGTWGNIAAILLAGAVISLVAATRPILQAAPLSLAVAGAYAIFNVAAVFAWWSVFLVVIAPLWAMLVSFLFVTAFRQLTEERAKRQIRDMFAHALSPALVDRLLEDPSLADLGGHRTELTCMFSDLAGFTPLSESLGPQETVALLNRYFDGVTEIVQNRCGGYLNKFLGDGIFVFFGAPVFQADHPSRAVDAALQCQTAVAELNEALSRELGNKVKLRVRIGIHSGEAMVGNCGSTQRMDYTAIGDCVNLSARLESANKFFGTGIMISRHAWGLCERDDLFTRPLGDVFITGVRDSLEVREVVGTAAELDDSRQRGLSLFAEAMGLVYHGRFADALVLLEQCDELIPGDPPTGIYLDICRQCIAHPSADTWPEDCKTQGGVVRLAWPEEQ